MGDGRAQQISLKKRRKNKWGIRQIFSYHTQQVPQTQKVVRKGSAGYPGKIPVRVPPEDRICWIFYFLFFFIHDAVRGASVVLTAVVSEEATDVVIR